MTKFCHIMISTIIIIQLYLSTNVHTTLTKLKRSDAKNSDKRSQDDYLDNMRNYPEAGLVLQDRKKTGGMLVIEGLDSFMFIPKKHDCEKDHPKPPATSTSSSSSSTQKPSTTSHKPLHSPNPGFITNRPSRPIRPSRPFHPRPSLTAEKLNTTLTDLNPIFNESKTIDKNSDNDDEEDCQTTGFLALLGLISKDQTKRELCQSQHLTMRERRKPKPTPNYQCRNNKFCPEGGNLSKTSRGEKLLNSSVTNDLFELSKSPIAMKNFLPFIKFDDKVAEKRQNIADNIRTMKYYPSINKVNENILRRMYEKYENNYNHKKYDYESEEFYR